MIRRSLIALGILIACSTGAHAEVVATSGDVVEIAAPVSVVPNALESDTEIRVFDEPQGVNRPGSPRDCVT